VIISRMARGVDTASHRRAIAAKGKTIAVFGTGVDVIYPKGNSRLSEQILALGGALTSEFGNGNPLRAAELFHPQPNFSGMSVGVLVVEAAQYSGTRITARCALEQNRDVFAVPGKVTNKSSLGTKYSDQARRKARRYMGGRAGRPARGGHSCLLTPPAQSESGAPASASLFPDEVLPPPHAKKLLNLLKSDETTYLDELVKRLENEMSSSEIFAALSELELTGKIRQMPAKNFVKSV
jgi:DNA processing protein